MWDNIDVLRSLSHGLVWLAVVAGLAAVGATAGRYYVDQRANRLQVEVRAASDAQNQAKREQRERELQKLAEDAQAAAEVERAGRLKLENRLAPRVISEPDLETLARSLGAFSGQSFKVITYMDDAESNQLAAQIGRALEDARWTADRQRGWLAIVEFGVQVNVDKRAGENAKRAGASLTASLLAKGIQATLVDKYYDEAKPELVQIRVGKKPF